MSEYRFITTDTYDDGQIVRICLNRPRTRNAQSRGLLVELDSAFRDAEMDDAVKVVILAGAGPIFSSGHDMGSRESIEEKQPGPDQHVSYRTDGGSRTSVEKVMLQEWHYFFDNTRRWRNLRKITIAEVKGTVFAAGLMLMWACDLIVAEEGTQFADVVGTRLGMCGVEYFGHPWEFGPRRAKELLLTGDALGVDEAHRIGMVSKVFPAQELQSRTLDFARRISARPSVTALLIKESVNQSVDNMGFYNALNACFTLHELNHAHWGQLNGGEIVARSDQGAQDWASAPPVQLRREDEA